MIKIVVVIILLGLVYFFFIKPDLPQYLEFKNQQYGPSKLQTANDSRSKMYRYNSESNTNSDYILLLKPDADSGDAGDFLTLFSSHFSKQGFVFKTRGEQMLGLRDDGVVYMTTLPSIDLLVILVVETSNKPRSMSDAQEIFNSLSQISI